MNRVPWVALAGLTLACPVWAVLRLWSLWPQLVPTCPIKQFTGIPCLACGMTRCLAALSKGDLALAFHWHPVGLGVLLLLPVVGVWDLVRALRGRDYPSLPEKAWARWAVLGTLAGTWWLQVARGI